MANTYLSHQPSTGVSLATKATLSFWVKRAKIDSSNTFYGILSSRGGWNDGTGFAIGWYNDNLVWYNLKNSTGYRTLPANDRKFRDCNAWYHIVYKIDTTQSAIQDRITLYVNGEDQGDMTFSGGSISDVIPNQNDAPYYFFQSGDDHQIGRWGNAGSSGYFDGSLSHFHFCDGTAYDASAFGSTDSTTGEWKINTSPSVSYGNNGFFILKDGNSGTDQSGNSNNWSLGGGTLTNTEDCPSNVFATLNPLSCGSNIVFTNGNTGYQTHDNWESAPTTLAMSSGKYYCEFKPTSVLGSSNSFIMFGVEEPKNVNAWRNNYPGYTGTGYAYGWDGDKRNNAGTSSYGNSFSQNDIIGIALDMDNKKLYFHKNGTYQNSGDPTSGATGTGALSLTGDEYYFVVSGYHNGANATCKSNFGNGYFGTTAVSSAGTNASGIGIFEYDVPTGFTALSTKGLNE